VNEWKNVLQVSISTTFYARLLRQYFGAKKITKPKRKWRKAAQSTFMQKICMQNVDENDYYRQFHQH